MRSRWKWFRRFLTAEEVPRWFGLSLVLIYLVGLGSVAHYGIVQARREGAVYFQRSGCYAVSLLAKQLSALPGGDVSDPKLVGAYQRALRDFTANVPTRSLRVVDSDGRIIASTNMTEIGTPVENRCHTPGGEFEGGLMPGDWEVTSVSVPRQNAPDTLVLARLSASDDSGTVLYLEARLPPEPPGVSSLADQARTLAIVLVVLGALFVVYRCLREQLRGMSRIADRLQSHGDRLEDELSSLHIADTIDGVTSAWNELVGLTQRLREAVQRSEAAEELSRALQGSSDGALAEALSAVPDAIIYIADEGRFEYANSAACRLLGWADGEAKQTTLSEAHAQGIGAQVLDLLRDALQPDGFFEARNKVLTADNEDGQNLSSYRVRVIPLPQARHQGECVVLVRDVSQQIRAESAREEFITQVTHELRTPLTNIRAYAETLSSGMFDDPNLITECYNVITKETRRLSRLIEDILSVSQLEVGTIELAIGDVDLKTLLGEGVRDVRGVADEKNIDLQLVLPAKLELIRGDRDKLAVVINNLLGNAIKYTPANGNILVGCQFTGNGVVITVKDNGLGIDPADHGRIFEKFQRAGDPEVQSEPGTGIGLYTAREIVRRHGGGIELVSEKGKGSTFLVRLPHQESRAAALTTAEEV
ncbi:MAG: ATP-binding protein [Phycisphaerae bacterium]